MSEHGSPCTGCQDRQICGTGVFVRIADHLRPVCVHLCDELDVREWLVEIERLRAVLHRIASMPIEPRPDGTYNYDRAAIIEIAQRALNEETNA